MNTGTRVRYWWGPTGNRKRCIGRFIRKDGAYHYFMRGPGSFSETAKNIIELYPNEFTVIK